MMNKLMNIGDLKVGDIYKGNVLYIDNKNQQVRVEITKNLIGIVDLYNISDNPNVKKFILSKNVKEGTKIKVRVLSTDLE